MRAVAKRSIGKLSSGGAKNAYRLFVDDVAVTELVVARESGVAEPSGESRTLSHLLVEHGVTVVDSSLEHARATAKAATAELPRSAFVLSSGEPVLVTEVISSTSTRSNQ
jgi:hypothetical protein